MAQPANMSQDEIPEPGHKKQDAHVADGKRNNGPACEHVSSSLNAGKAAGAAPPMLPQGKLARADLARPPPSEKAQTA
ncbi:MAG: hypothetical protein AB7G35_11070 [Hyphomicrobiaceae bacterium]